MRLKKLCIEMVMQMGDFFKQFFVDKTNSSKYRYLNTEQLDNMASSTVGTVVDTAEITVDIMGVVISGNTAKIMLKVTANQLASVLYDTGIKPLKNYRFNDDVSGSLFEDLGMASTRYYYSDEEESLAPNQFEILYTAIGKGTLGKEKYTIVLKNLGYFAIGDGPGTDFVPIYNGSWRFDIAFDPGSDTCKNVLIDQQVTAGNYNFVLNSVNITPLACTIHLQCNPEDEYLNDHLDEIYKAFLDGTEDCCLTLSNDVKLSNEQFERSNFGGEAGFTIMLTFNVPVTVEDVVSISLFGSEYSLK